MPITPKVPPKTSSVETLAKLLWSRYLTIGPDSREQFDLRRLFEDAEYLAIKLAALIALLIILYRVDKGHF